MIFFLTGVVSVLAIRAYYIQKTEIFVPKYISYQIDPPTEALGGQITDLSGDVKKFSRTSIDFETTKTGEKVLLGESIATGEDGKVIVEFSDFAKISFAPNSEAAFVETSPNQFSVRQSSGVMTYEGNDKPINIRSMHLLISLIGAAKVNVDSDNGQITVNLISGTASLGMMDHDNKTSRWDLKMGQRILIDDKTRSVRSLY